MQTVAAESDFVDTSEQNPKNTFNVPATAGDDSHGKTWVSTGLNLTGNPVTITGSGSAEFGPGLSTGPSGPANNSEFAGKQPNKCPQCPLTGAPVGALIAKVGKQKPVLVGSGPTVLSGTGRLYFAFNDGYGDHGDNSGSYTAVVTEGGSPAGNSLQVQHQSRGGETDQYMVTLEKFRVTKTRALHNDDDVVSLAAQVSGQQPQKKSTFVPGVNDGEHEVNLKIGPFSVASGQKLTFDYIINNQGGGSVGDVSKYAEAAAGVLDQPEISAGIAAAQSVMGETLPGIFTSGACNGIVAADRIEASSALLKGWTTDTGTHTEEKFYPGTDSAVGCGSNSQYYVTWTVSKAGTDTKGTGGE